VVRFALPHTPEVEMISLQRVTKTYKNGVTAHTDVTVEVDKGEFVFIVGQSGSGKSTMIRLLLKEEEATKGDIYVGGKNLGKMSSWDVPKLRRNVGTVFQDYKLLTDKTVFDNVAFGLEVIGKQKHVIDQRVPEILEYVGLCDKLNNYPDELSGGEQQRVSIARACVNRPLVLLADEPTGNLDSKMGQDILELIKSMSERTGVTVVLVTHDLRAAAYGDRMITLRDGRIIDEVTAPNHQVAHHA
jgi:cell division transport system ATP-binding protein